MSIVCLDNVEVQTPENCFYEQQWTGWVYLLPEVFIKYVVYKYKMIHTPLTTTKPKCERT